VLCLAVKGTSVFAGTRDGIFRSDNSGAGWTKADMGASGIIVNSIAVGGNALFAGTGDGIFISTDNGNSWTTANSGLFNVNVVSLIKYGAALFAGTEGNGIFCSFDSGTTWTKLSSCPPNSSGQHLEAGNNGIYTLRGSGVYVSADNGATWTLTLPDLDEPNIWSFDVNGDRLLLSGGPGLFHSTSTDTKWNLMNPSPRLIISLASSGATICAGGIGGVSLSTDNGANWKQYSYSDLSYFGWFTLDIAILGDTILTATEGGGVFVLSKDGTIWKNCTTGLTSNYCTSLSWSDGCIFAGTTNGVCLSTNTGESWTSVNSGLPNLSISSLAIYGGNLFAGTQYQGVWRRPLSEMTGVTSAQLKPQSTRQADFKIRSVRRGNHDVRIAFSLPCKDRATVKIFDLSGREIASLADQRLDPGSYSLTWDTRNVAKGCYLLRICAGSNTATQSIAVFR
jgi:hypothetical protein